MKVFLDIEEILFQSAELRMTRHFACWIWSFYSMPPAPEGNQSLQIWLKVIKLNMPSYSIAIFPSAIFARALDFAKRDDK